MKTKPREMRIELIQRDEPVNLRTLCETIARKISTGAIKL